MRFLENTPSDRQSSTSVDPEQQSSTSVVQEVTNTSSEVVQEDTPPVAADASVHNTILRELVEPVPGTSTQERSIPQSKSSEKSTIKNTKRKRQKEDEFIKFMKDRHESRNSTLESLKCQGQESFDDISTFTKHIETMLRKLSARSRAMAKSEIFNIISKYEIGDIDGQGEQDGHQTPSDLSRRQLPCTSTSSYNTSTYSPISVASTEHQSQSELIDLTSRQLPNISSQPFRSIFHDEYDQDNLDDLTNLP